MYIIQYIVIICIFILQYICHQGINVSIYSINISIYIIRAVYNMFIIYLYISYLYIIKYHMFNMYYMYYNINCSMYML